MQFNFISWLSKDFLTGCSRKIKTVKVDNLTMYALYIFIKFPELPNTQRILIVKFFLGHPIETFFLISLVNAQKLKGRASIALTFLVCRA